MAVIRSSAIADASRTRHAAAAQERPPWFGFVLQLLRMKPLGAVSAVVVLLFLLCGIFADLLAPYPIDQVAPLNRLKPPSWSHPFGTDSLGRDVLSRCIHGARISMIIALVGATLACAISLAIGSVSGYLGGRVDLVIQRFVDAWMSFPNLVILIVVVSVFGPGLPQIVATLAVNFGIYGSRIVRSAAISVREAVYVRAAQSIGATDARILWRHIVPNVLPAAIVLFTSSLGGIILAESALSFLGLGVPPPTPTWGGMLSGTGRTFMFQGPWLVIAPGLCLTVVVFCTNMFGDALRDLLDPRLRGGR
jgi:peptide/nickel transport system permease protein